MIEFGILVNSFNLCFGLKFFLNVFICFLGFNLIIFFLGILRICMFVLIKMLLGFDVEFIVLRVVRF